MNKAEIKAQAKEFVAKGKKFFTSVEGRVAFSKLPFEVQSEVHEMRNDARGVRRVNGKLEFTQKGLKAEIERLEEKQEMYSERSKTIKVIIAEKKAEYAERFESNK